MTTSVYIAPATLADWPHIRRIYQDGIESRNATFETEVPDDGPAWFAQKLQDGVLKAELPPGCLAGWAALSPTSNREVYAGVVETSVYVSRDAAGQGIGRNLLRALIELSEQRGIWTLQAGIFPENQASIQLHTALGFRCLARREKIGKHHGQWRDILLMERRSQKVI